MVGVVGEPGESPLLVYARDRIRVAANAVVLRGDEAVLVEFSGGTPRVHFNFPGGGVEVGETLEEAVRREALEETCLEVTVQRLLLVVESVGARNSNVIHGQRLPWNEVRFFFLCAPTSDVNAARLPSVPDGNQTGVKWIPLEQLPLEPVLPQVCRELIAALRAPGKHPLVIPNPSPPAP